VGSWPPAMKHVREPCSSMGHTAWLLALAFSGANTPIQALRQTSHNSNGTVEHAVAGVVAGAHVPQAETRSATAAPTYLRRARANGAVDTAKANKTEPSPKHPAQGGSAVADNVINRTRAAGKAREVTPVDTGMKAGGATAPSHPALSVSPETGRTVAGAVSKASNIMSQQSGQEPANQQLPPAVATTQNRSAQTVLTNSGASNLTLSKLRQAAPSNASQPSDVLSHTAANHLAHAQANVSGNTQATAAMHAVTHGSGLNRSADQGECSMACFRCKMRATKSDDGTYCCWSYYQLGECRAATVTAPKPGSFICQGYDNVYQEGYNCITATGTCCIDGRY